MSFRRCLLALPLLAFAASAPAVEFDEKVRAPQVRSGAELKPRLESYAALMKALNERSPLEVVKDRSVLKERFDARWLLGRMVDSRQPLPELEALGFTARPDGGFVIDTRVHPEWQLLDSSLTMLTNAGMLGGAEDALVSRGMSREQFEVLSKYVREHDLEAAKDRSKLEIVISAGKLAKKLHKLKRLNDDFMWSYFYQRALEDAKVTQTWASGLLAVLEPHSQRVLASYLSEGAASLFIGPTPVEPALQYERDQLLRPDLEQFARKAFAEGNL